MITTKLICRLSDGLCVAAYSDALSPEECLAVIAKRHPDCFAVVARKDGGFGCRMSKDGRKLSAPEPATAPENSRTEELRAKIRAGKSTVAEEREFLRLSV